MEDVRIILSALWVALMLTYLVGDVLRIFAHDFKSGEARACVFPINKCRALPITFQFIEKEKY